MYDVPIEHPLPAGAGMVHLRPIHYPEQQAVHPVIELHENEEDDDDVVEIVTWPVPPGAGVYTYAPNSSVEQEEEDEDETTYSGAHNANQLGRFADDPAMNNYITTQMNKLETLLRNARSPDERNQLLNDFCRIPCLYKAFLRLARQPEFYNVFPTTTVFSINFNKEREYNGVVQHGQQPGPAWQQHATNHHQQAVQPRNGVWVNVQNVQGQIHQGPLVYQQFQPGQQQ